jgi:hypothetical protein
MDFRAETKTSALGRQIKQGHCEIFIKAGSSQ